MKIPASLLALIFFLLSLLSCKGQIEKTQRPSSDTTYTYKTGDRNGIGKWYKGREIAHVMGFQGINWLERSEREEEENTTTLLNNMNIQPKDHIADVGAGSGYHVFNMAPLAKGGTVYAVDIQDEMLAAINGRISTHGVSNVETVKGSPTSTNLAENALDKVLMVDVYHEFDFPVEMMASIHKALKQDGKIFLVEYRREDASVPIKNIHKMTENQAVKEMTAAGFKLEENISNLPWQHCMVFVKN